MKFVTRYCRPLASVLFALLSAAPCLWAQSSSPIPSFGVCKAVTQRTTDVGCWVLTDHPIGRIDQAQVSWHLDVYPTRAEAEKAKGPRGTVIESLGKVWLLTIEKAGWRPALKGERVSEIGPIPVTAGGQYSAVFMEVIFNPGMTSDIHIHSGPEVWYNLAGESCLETPNGKQVARAGGPPVIVPSGPMQLTTTGTQQRRGIVLILHDASKPPTTIIHDWTPKGLCNASEGQISSSK